MTTILRFHQVRKRTGFSRATVYRRIRKGEFPLPLDLGNGQLGWVEEEIEAWVGQRPRRVPKGHGRSKAEAGEDEQLPAEVPPRPP